MDPRIENINVHKALSAIADIAMPRVCVVCGRALIPQEKDICLECLADLPETRFWLTSHNPMADKFNALVDDTHYCYAAALYWYDEDAGYKNISQSLKYRRNFSVGKHFGEMLGEELAGSEQFCDVDAIVPVPLHWTRRWKRGYNQAEIIAKEIASVLSATLDNKILRRIKRTKTQTKVTIGQKSQNVKGAFKSLPGKSYNHILLVDDVFTTGSTLSACHAALRDHYGPEIRISVATLGYVK